MKVTGPKKSTVDCVLERDGYACVLCGSYVAGRARGVAWSIHHRRPRGMGGSSMAGINDPDNLVVVCGSGVDGCHGWIESNREEARSYGYLVGLNTSEKPSSVPMLHTSLGWVQLNPDGTYTVDLIEPEPEEE